MKGYIKVNWLLLRYLSLNESTEILPIAEKRLNQIWLFHMHAMIRVGMQYTQFMGFFVDKPTP